MTNDSVCNLSETDTNVVYNDREKHRRIYLYLELWTSWNDVIESISDQLQNNQTILRID